MNTRPAPAAPVERHRFSVEISGPEVGESTGPITVLLSLDEVVELLLGLAHCRALHLQPAGKSSPAARPLGLAALLRDLAPLFA
jgi:hypothetical protein